MKHVLDILKERGLLEAVTSDEVFRLVEKPTVVYAGFDPSSSSLQVGNYVTIMALAHFQRCGHRVIALVGGATGMIGDPAGKSNERNLLSAEQVEHNLQGIRENLGRFLDFDDTRAPASIVNNNDWFQEFTFVEFLRDVGKHFRVGAMLGKESVRTRLNSESGMSFAEFSYQLLQAYDFLRLHDTSGCRLQIGGSDQWGNITAGADLIRKLREVEAYGMTFPLICDSSGQKFGKSEGNAIYLDQKRTSVYDFYQFFIRATDADVIRLLKVFTFLPLDDVAALEEALTREPEKRVAQKKLAEEVTRAVHGEAGLRIALRASDVLFGGELAGLKAEDLLKIFANVDSSEMDRDHVAGQPVVEVVTACGLCKSKGEARRLIESGGLYVNNRRISSMDARVDTASIIDERVLVLRSGKRKFFLVKVI